MSMRNHGCHGHVVKASELVNLLPVEKVKEYIDAIEEGNCETAEDILKNYLPKNIPLPEIFTMQDEFESEDLEIGETYACWYKEDLFEFKKTEAMILLENFGITPEPSNWVTFG